MWWILYGYYVMFMCGGQNSWFYKASLRICYVTLFECKGPSMLKTVANYHVWNRGLQNQAEKVPCTVFLNYLHTFVFNIFSDFLILVICIINIGYWQVLFYKIGTLRKILYSATSIFKCRGSTAAVLVLFFIYYRFI